MLLLNYVCAKIEVLRAMRGDKRGVTAVEYGLIAALIAVVIIVGVTALGTRLSTMFRSVSNSVSNATP